MVAFRSCGHPRAGGDPVTFALLPAWARMNSKAKAKTRDPRLRGDDGFGGDAGCGQAARYENGFGYGQATPGRYGGDDLKDVGRP